MHDNDNDKKADNPPVSANQLSRTKNACRDFVVVVVIAKFSIFCRADETLVDFVIPSCELLSAQSKE